MAVSPIFTDRFSLSLLVMTRDGGMGSMGDIGKLIPRGPPQNGMMFIKVAK